MGLKLLLLPNSTLVLRMWGQPGDFNGHGLVVGGANDTALERAHGLDGGRGERARGVEGSGLGEEGERGWAGEKRGGEGERFELGEREVKERHFGWMDKKMEVMKIGSWFCLHRFLRGFVCVFGI